ncbi:unnamed protein product [Dibothriocephalus latus]|uniref:RNase III domain-containing protein n=1 Tax=Dibothriocephalus latus TaxID=60516 RepID=A0A3P7PDG2_DIBLA|nr:unnamed protein product [Dibothriocephalus latus]
MPDMCILHPLNAWLWLTLCLTPTVIYQVTRCLSACELANLLTCRLYDHHTDNAELPFGLPEGDFFMPDRGSVSLTDIPPLHRYFDHLPRENRLVYDKFETLEEELVLDEAKGARASGDCTATGYFVPDPIYLLEATTTLNAVDAVNLERLELLGDSMLKFAASLLVYSSLPPSADEGQLTYLRMGHISNANLHRLSVELGIYHYLWSFSFDPTKHYTPPGRAAVDEPSRKLWSSSESWNLLLLPPDRPLDPDLVSEDQVSMDRRHAEVEVLIADSMPTTGHSANSGANEVDTLAAQLANRLTLVPLSQTLVYKKNQLAGLESILGYKFRHMRLLIQAITHASSLSAHDWGCYQRLEFLGDAILDFVVTQRIFAEHSTFNPGEFSGPLLISVVHVF